MQEFAHERPYFAARVEPLAETNTTGPQVEARAEVLKARAIEALSLLPQVPAELARTIQSIESPSRLADLIISFMDVKAQEKQEMLETLNLQERLDKVLKVLANRLEVLKITRDITEQTQSALGERQREAVLREQLRQLQKELGEGEDSGVEIDELEKQIEKANMPCRSGRARSQGAQAAAADERGEPRARDAADLSRLAGRACRGA